MFASFVLFYIFILVRSNQSDNNYSPSSLITSVTCLKIGLWTIWFNVNNTNNASIDNNRNTYLTLIQIANNTCTTPIYAQIQLLTGSRSTRRIRKSLSESGDFNAFISLFSSLLNSLNFRIRFCCDIASFVSTTTTTTPEMTTTVINPTSDSVSTMTVTDTIVSTVLLISPDGAVCGKQEITPRASLTTRIFGGTDAIRYSWPWMINYRQIATCDMGPCYIECGGTLIDKEYVITAAHCIRTTNPSDITLIAGAYNQSSIAETDTRQVRTVQEIHVHPDYNSTIFINDITVLRVDTSFTYTTYVQPACLPGAEPQPGDEVVIIGWGSEMFGGNTVDNLKQGYTTVVGNCDTYWAPVNNARQICVANSVTGNSACQGDSGGPILSSDNGQYVVSGVASYVHDCNTLGASNSPNVYTRVSAYETWIHSIIGQK